MEIHDLHDLHDLHGGITKRQHLISAAAVRRVLLYLLQTKLALWQLAAR